jgi:hypothetical protein
MVFDMFQYFRANYEIEILILKRQVGNIRRDKTPPAAPVFAQAVMKFEPIRGFIQVLQSKVGADSDYIGQPICCAGMPTRTASNIENFKTRLNPQPVKFDGNHR